MKNKTPSARWSLPSMEDLKLNMPYAFSFNPEAQPRDFNVDCIPKWFTSIIKTVGKLKACTVEMSVEISKLGRLHFHGTLTVHKSWQFYYYDVPMLCKEGSFEIDTIGKIDEWQTYIDKNKTEMMTMMKEFGLPRTIATKTTPKIKEDTKRWVFKEEPLTDDSDSTERSNAL